MQFALDKNTQYFIINISIIYPLFIMKVSKFQNARITELYSDLTEV